MTTTNQDDPTRHLKFEDVMTERQKVELHQQSAMRLRQLTDEYNKLLDERGVPRLE